MKNAIKHIRLELDKETGTALYSAMEAAKKQSGKWFNASDIVRPAVEGFIRSAEAGNAAEYVKALGGSQESVA